MRVVWSPQARRDAARAVEFIARDRPATAADWLGQIHQRLVSLQRFPSSGRIVPEFDKQQYREVIVTPYRVIYRVEPKRVYVLAVWHGRQTLSEADLDNEGP